MEISFQTKHVSLTDDHRALIGQKLEHLGHIADGLDRVEVRFHEERNPRISEKEVCEVTMVTRWAVIRAKSSGPDIMAAVDKVTEKLEHRLEKMKGKLIGRSQPHHRQSKPAEHGFDGNGLDELALLGGAKIVRAKSFSIPEMSPSEAALKMQLLSHNFYFFTNHETGRPAVVYQRDDGDVGVIDASEVH